MDADEIAVKIMPAASFDPNVFRHYIARLQPRSLVSLANLNNIIHRLPIVRAEGNDNEFSAIQNEVRQQLVKTPAITQPHPGPSLLNPKNN